MAGSVIGSASGRSGSYAGSATSSRTSASRRARAGLDNQDGAGEDIFDRSSSFEIGIFGVLCTLRKENNEARVRIRWVLLKILLDALQLFTTVISPGRQGWSIDADGPAWKVVSVLNFNWISDISYGAYLALLYVMVGLLCMHIGLCVWVAWCFKEQKFPVVWPLKALRIFSSVFFQAFDVAALSLLELGITCRYTGFDEGMRMRFDLFPQYSCSSAPHVMHAVVSGLSLGLFVAIALLTNMAEVEVNLLSRRPFALGHSGPVVMAFGIKVLLTLVRVFIGWRRVQACLYLGLALAFAWQFIRWGPHLVSWVNYLRSGVAAVVVWCTGTLVLLVFHPGIKEADRGRWADAITLLMLLGLGPAFGVGALMSWTMIKRMTKATLQDLKDAKPGVPLQDVCMSMYDPQDVEIVVRCCRVWKDQYTVDPAAVEKARHVIQAGVAMFPNSAFMILLQANFMIDVLGVSQSGSRRIEDARKLNPGLMCRFIMFVRQQQASQQAAGNQAKGGTSMDLLAYVEYQRKQRMVVRLHREALQAMCNFWRALDSSRVSFTQLSKALGKVENSVSQAQTAYRVVLESYGNNPKLVRLYGKFLQTIKNDPWRATEYFTEADRLEELQSGDAGGPLLPDGTPLGRMDEIATAVLVISANGEVQMANRHAHLLFGYKRGTLEGKSMATLLAPHYTRWLSDHLSYIVDRSELLAAVSGGGRLGGGGAEGVGDGDGGGGAEPFSDTAVVVGMHSDRVAFPIKLTVRKASGVGEDSTFITMMEVVPAAKGVASLWVSHNGTIVACDPQFVMAFGWKSQEVNGSTLTSLMLVQGSLETAAATSETAVAAATDALEYSESGGAEAFTSALASPAGPSEAVGRLLQYARSSGYGGARGGGAGMQCLVAHKYDSEPVPCTATIVTSGLLDASVYEVNIHQNDAGFSRQMLVVNRKGSILHASPDLLAGLVGVADGGGRGGVGGGPVHLGGGGGGGPLPLAVPSMSASMAGGTPALTGGGAPAAVATAAAVAALGPVGLMGLEQLAAYTLCDFLPSPWKEMHYKYLKGTTTVSLPSRSPFTCRKLMPLGPTLELRTAGGKPLFMRVSVTTADVAGELNHVVRMARSSMEAALGERRLRLQLTHEGVICSVAEGGSAARLLGLDGCQLEGRALWEILDWSPYVGFGSLPAAGPLMFTALVRRALNEPGTSWRVQVSSKPAAAAAMGTTTGPTQTASELVAAARASMTKPAVLQVHVDLPTSAGGDEDTALFVDLWFLGGVSGVLEVDFAGRVRTVLEENWRPAGLLFGMPTPSLVGCKLEELLALPPGRRSPGDLLFVNGAKKSSLKATTVDTSFKVGPVHVLQGTHTDGQPNTLDVQAVGKPGPNQNVYVILRSHTAPMIPAAGVPPSRPPAAAAPAAAKPAPASGLLAAASMSRGAATAAGALAAAVATGQQQQQRQASPCACPSAAAAEGEMQVSTPPEPLQRRAAAAGNASGDILDDDFAVAIVNTSSPLPPLPEDLEGLGGGLPVPAVAPAKACTGRALMPAGRSKLGELVRSVEGNRGGSGVELGRTATAAGSSGGSRRARTQGGRYGGGGGSGGEIEGLEAEQDQGRAVAVSVGQEAGPRLSVDVESVDGANAEPLGAVGAPAGGKERISTWVASQGAYYQNSVCPDKTKGGDDDDDDDDEDGGGRLEPLLGADDLPTLDTVDLKALLRAGANGGGGDEDVNGKLAGAKAYTERGEGPAGGPGGEWVRRRGDARPLDSPPDDDAMSEGGQSAMSAQSGDGGADYKRGKRFRKLMKIMDSGQAHEVQRRYRVHALATVALLAAVHIVCFALTINAISTKRDSMLQLGHSGQAQRFMHQIMTDVRSLDIISRNKTHPNLYKPEDAEFFIQRISTGAEAVQARFKRILDSHQSSTATTDVKGLLFYSTRQVWNGKDNDGSDTYTNITIWDFVTRFCVMANEVEQHGRDWVRNRVAIAENTTAGQFLIKSGPDLWRASRQVLDALLYVAVDDARWVDNLQIVFLCVEGAAVTSVAACYLAYLLRAVAAQRYKLYSTFMLIPLGLTRALASQNTNLTVDGEDEDDDDDIDDKAPVTTEEPIGEGDDGPEAASAAAVAAKPKRRAMMAVFEPKRGSGGGGQGTKEGVSRDAVLFSPAKSADKNRNIRTRSGQPQQRTDDSADVGSSRTGSGNAGGAYGVLGRTALRLRQFFRRGIRVAPLLGSTSVSAGADGVAKRKLKYDSHETGWLLMPFVAWSALVVAIYTVVVTEMRGIVDVLAVHSVVNFIAARTYRAVFYSQELAATEDLSLLSPRRAAVAAVWKIVRDAWFTLQLGSDAYRAAGPQTERFPLVKAGLAYASPKMANIFYSNGQCHRIPAAGPCPGPEDRFYQISRSGLDSIMHQFMLHVEALGFSKSPVPPGLGDEHLDFIYNVGTRDLMDGTVEIQEAHLDTIMSLFQHLFHLHIVLLVMFWVIFAGFLIFLLNPMLTRISRERRRVAELMSQLPLELDVEKLVSRALGATSSSGTSAAAASAVAGMSGMGGAGSDGVRNGVSTEAADAAADTVTKWKNIIRSASNQLVKSQSGGSNYRGS